jgi:hypothetical protein
MSIPSPETRARAKAATKAAPTEAEDELTSLRLRLAVLEKAAALREEEQSGGELTPITPISHISPKVATSNPAPPIAEAPENPRPRPAPVHAAPPRARPANIYISPQSALSTIASGDSTEERRSDVRSEVNMAGDPDTGKSQTSSGLGSPGEFHVTGEPPIVKVSLMLGNSGASDKSTRPKSILTSGRKQRPPALDLKGAGITPSTASPVLPQAPALVTSPTSAHGPARPSNRHKSNTIASPRLVTDEPQTPKSARTLRPAGRPYCKLLLFGLACKKGYLHLPLALRDARTPP